MWRAALWGGIAGSSVFIGSLIALFFNIKKSVIGFIMAFGTGVLMGAAAFELLTEAVENGGITVTAISFILGAALFTLFNLIIAKKGGHSRKRSQDNITENSGIAIFMGTVMDAIPESVIIGVSLTKEENISLLLVVAIFISNFPEGLSSSSGLKKAGYSKTKILVLWLIVSFLAILSSIVGFIFLEHGSEALIATISSFAAGGIVAMLSSTMMPEAYEDGGPIVGLISALGLISSVILSNLK
ncbi:ZIP family metal transporter [Orenia marismortui]|uniref:ZIP family metal transporter n=1 Tax=Orenia marismortui TaxID=46469 RepID=UPI00036DD956|nr:ZIP family metal transporter [Orenia marismortui]